MHRAPLWRTAGVWGWRLGAALLLLLALEGASRVVGLRFPSLAPPGGDRALWVYDETLGWSHAPSSQGAISLGGPDRGTARINSMGLRGPEVSLRKPAGTRRLLVFGDSFAFGVGVDQEHLMTHHLATRLDASGGGPWEVINLAVSGYATDQELILFSELGARLHPDVVLLVACDNDFEGNTSGFEYQRYYKPYFVTAPGGQLSRRHLPVPRLSVAERARLWMAQSSNLWNAVRTRRPTHPVGAAIVHRFWVRPPLSSGEDPVALTAALVTEFRDRARAAGARFALTNTGHRGEQTPLFQELRVHLRREGIPFLGLEGELQRARDARPEGHWDFAHDTHWNTDAHRRVAEVVHAFLRQQGLLDVETPPRPDAR